jgi:hypothetical protein
MRTGRAIIVSALLALGVAGSILASPAMSPAAGHASGAHVQAADSSVAPSVYYHA